MSISQTYFFDNEDDFNATDVDIVSEKAQLGVEDNPGQVFAQTFDDDTGFTYDSDLAEFVAGIVRQKDQTPANSRFAVDYDGNHSPVGADANLNWFKSGGSLIAGLNGSPVITSGELVCSGAQGVYYSGQSQAVETIKFIYKPNYTTSPPVNINLCSTYNGSNNNDRLEITNSPSGDNIRATLYNSTGSVVITVATVINDFEPVAGQAYEIEVVIDSTAGTLRVFVDGTLLGTLSPGAWTRGGVSTRYYLGATPTSYNRAEGSFDKLIVFSDAQHTGTYTPGYTLPGFIYAESKVDMPVFSYSGIGTIQAVESSSFVETGSPRYTVAGLYWNGSSFAPSDGSYAQANDASTLVAQLPNLTVQGAENVSGSVIFPDTNSQANVDSLSVTVTGQRYKAEGYIEPAQNLDIKNILDYEQSATIPGDTEIAIQLRVNSALYYHDGSNWVVSDGSFNQANSASEVKASISDFDLGPHSEILFRWKLKTDDQQVTPLLDSATVDYNFGGISEVGDKCNVWGYVKDMIGTPLKNAHVTITPYKPSKENLQAASNIIWNKPIKVKTDSFGYFEAELLRSSAFPTSQKYRVEIRHVGYTREHTITVPNEDNVNFTDLI